MINSLEICVKIKC